MHLIYVIHNDNKHDTCLTYFTCVLILISYYVTITYHSEMGMPKRRFMDVVKEDMTDVEVTEEDTEDRDNRRWKIQCVDP